MLKEYWRWDSWVPAPAQAQTTSVAFGKALFLPSVSYENMELANGIFLFKI